MSITSILRLGGPPGSEISIDILRQALLSHFQADAGTASPSSQSPPKTSLNLQLDNKYFTASVTVHPLDYESKEHAMEQEDGIVLVIASTLAGLEPLTEWHDVAQTKDRAGDSLRLLLATSAMEPVVTKQYEEQYSQRVLWCLDRGYEYIEVNVTEKGLSRGFDEREKNGFARVCEAMSGTVWSSAIMKKRQQQNQQQQQRQPSVSKIVVQNEESTGSSSSQAQKAQPVESTQESKQEEIESKPSSAISSPEPASPSPPPSAEEKEEKEQEEYFQNIEHIMKEAQHIRQASKQGEMSDEQRRQRAGDAASMLMGLLDQIGFDEEDCAVSSSDEDK